jgi:hypothetical protein
MTSFKLIEPNLTDALGSTVGLADGYLKVAFVAAFVVPSPFIHAY